MLIKEVEELTGIKSVNIRHYEKENLIHPLRKANGYREYSEEDVRRLKQIKTLRLLDVSVSDIQKILNDQITLKAAMEKRLNELNKEEMKIKEIRATCELIISENVSITNLDENILHGDKNTWKERLEQIMKEDIDRRFLSKAILYITGWAVLARILYIGILAFKTTDITLQNLLTLRPSGIEFYLSLGIGIFFLLYGSGLSVYEGLTGKDFLWVWARDWGGGGLGGLANSFAFCGIGIAIVGNSTVIFVGSLVIVCLILTAIRGYIMIQQSAAKEKHLQKTRWIMLAITVLLLLIFIVAMKLLQYAYIMKVF